MKSRKIFVVIFFAMILAAQGIANAAASGGIEAKELNSEAVGNRSASGMSDRPEADESDSRDNILDQLFEQISQQPPSELFASGVVFDIVRQNHETFEEVVRSNNALLLQQFFAAAYSLYCENPEVVGYSSSMVNINNNDTDPAYWNADLFSLANGDAAALCYMSVQNDSVEARIFGIVLSDLGDRYYYCMLDKDEDAYSDVMQNKALYGIEKVGEVKGRGFDLMNDFLACMES